MCRGHVQRLSEGCSFSAESAAWCSVGRTVFQSGGSFFHSPVGSSRLSLDVWFSLWPWSYKCPVMTGGQFHRWFVLFWWLSGEPSFFRPEGFCTTLRWSLSGCSPTCRSCWGVWVIIHISSASSGRRDSPEPSWQSAVLWVQVRSSLMREPLSFTLSTGVMLQDVSSSSGQLSSPSYCLFKKSLFSWHQDTSWATSFL